MVPIADSASIALALLLKRLKWPVPMVRWRAAKEVRNLLTAAATRAAATEQLLEALEDCACESEVCTLLTIVFLTTAEARPSREVVISRIKYPSILADMLLERTYGSGMGGWLQTYAGEAPSDFEAGGYFEKYSTAHVPPILGNNLRQLQRVSGFPFRRQWGYEWKALRDRLGTHFTGYPHYFSRALEARSGIMGQFWQRMRDVYVSAYLRTLAHAVNRWGLPKNIAEQHCLDIVDGVAGIFEIEPGIRPAWLSDLPERFCERDADFSVLARRLCDASRQNGMVAVSINVPIATSTKRYAQLEITTHLITANYAVPAGESLYERMPPLMIGQTFEVNGAPPEITLDEASSAGSKGGDESAVCIGLRPIPFGVWHGDLYSVGLTIPAPYVVEDTKLSCSTQGIDLISDDKKLVSTTRVWNDEWTPAYPKGGSTRCGVVTMMDDYRLEEARVCLGRRLASYVRLRIWELEGDYGDYVKMERSELVLL